MTPLIVALPGNEALAASLASKLGGQVAEMEFRRFPDEETYLRYLTPAAGRAAILICTLDRPDAKILPLMFAAATARKLGAAQVGLVAPYLAYMRQDKTFKTGEAVTAGQFARLLSTAVDWLVTVDPHLHRVSGLGAIYRVPATAAHAAPLISRWIRAEVASPLIVGPDSESTQWVRAVAEGADAPYTVLEKVRRGDYDVEVSVPGLEHWRERTPVLVDDIISTGRTMIATIGHLTRLRLKAPVCVGVHAVFAGGSCEALRAEGAARIVTTNTIAHETNAIDVSSLLAQAIANMTALPRPGKSSGD